LHEPIAQSSKAIANTTAPAQPKSEKAKKKEAKQKKKAEK